MVSLPTPYAFAVAGADLGSSRISVDDVISLSASGQMAGVTARGVIAHVPDDQIFGDLPAEYLV